MTVLFYLLTALFVAAFVAAVVSASDWGLLGGDLPDEPYRLEDGLEEDTARGLSAARGPRARMSSLAERLEG